MTISYTELKSKILSIREMELKARGNFGHQGRPGLVGGSSSSSNSISLGELKNYGEKIRKLDDQQGISWYEPDLMEENLNEHESQIATLLDSDFSNWDLANWKERSSEEFLNSESWQRINTLIEDYSKNMYTPPLVRGVKNQIFKVGDKIKLPPSDWTDDIDLAKMYGEGGYVLHLPEHSKVLPTQLIDKNAGAPGQRFLHEGGEFEVIKIEGNNVVLQPIEKP